MGKGGNSSKAKGANSFLLGIIFSSSSKSSSAEFC